MRRLLREPLLHFFILGALLFALYGWLHRGASDAPNEIFVSRGQLQSLEAQFERVWQRPATSQELQGLVDNWVREEIFYREGLAMGLDRDDPIVRRRIGQKMQFIVDDVAPAAPSEAEMQKWLDEHAASYRVEPTYSLRQIYFNPDRHGERLQSDLEAARRALTRGESVQGDSTMLPSKVDSSPPSDIERTFGAQFTAALTDLPIGSWQGPVQSAFGWHLVEVTARGVGRQAKLNEVRATVEREVSHAKSEAANAALYERLRANYRVRIDNAAAASPHG